MASVNAPLDPGRPPALLDGLVFRETIVSDGGSGPTELIVVPLPVANTRWVLLAVTASPTTALGNVGDLLVTVPDGEGTRQLLRLGGAYDSSLGTTRSFAHEHLTGLAFWSFTFGGAEALVTLSVDNSVGGPHDATIFNLTWKLEYSSAAPQSNAA